MGCPTVLGTWARSWTWIRMPRADTQLCCAHEAGPHCSLLQMGASAHSQTETESCKAGLFPALLSPALISIFFF